jgi:hypothetical protein
MDRRCRASLSEKKLCLGWRSVRYRRSILAPSIPLRYHDIAEYPDFGEPTGTLWTNQFQVQLEIRLRF